MNPAVVTALKTRISSYNPLFGCLAYLGHHNKYAIENYRLYAIILLLHNIKCIHYCNILFFIETHFRAQLYYNNLRFYIAKCETQYMFNVLKYIFNVQERNFRHTS